MSRFEGKFTAAREAALDAAELLAALRTRSGASEADRANAIACYLSGGDGWRGAVEKLGGAFAPIADESPQQGQSGAPGLSEVKDA